MIDNPDHVAAPVAKAASAVGVSVYAVGFNVSTAASWAALIYSTLLISEWLWKRVIKPLALRRGWLKPKFVITHV